MHGTNNFMDFDIMASSLKAKVKRIGGIGQTRDTANPSDRHLVYDNGVNSLHSSALQRERDRNRVDTWMGIIR